MDIYFIIFYVMLRKWFNNWISVADSQGPESLQARVYAALHDTALNARKYGPFTTYNDLSTFLRDNISFKNPTNRNFFFFNMYCYILFEFLCNL